MTMREMSAMLNEEQNYSDEAPMDTCIEKFFFTKVFQAFQAKLINFWIGHISRDFVTQTQKLELSELSRLHVFALFTSSLLCKLSHFANVSSELEFLGSLSFFSPAVQLWLFAKVSLRLTNLSNHCGSSSCEAHIFLSWKLTSSVSGKSSASLSFATWPVLSLAISPTSLNRGGTWKLTHFENYHPIILFRQSPSHTSFNILITSASSMFSLHHLSRSSMLVFLLGLITTTAATLSSVWESPRPTTEQSWKLENQLCFHFKCKMY